MGSPDDGVLALERGEAWSGSLQPFLAAATRPPRPRPPLLDLPQLNPLPLASASLLILELIKTEQTAVSESESQFLPTSLPQEEWGPAVLSPSPSTFFLSHFLAVRGGEGHRRSPFLPSPSRYIKT